MAPPPPLEEASLSVWQIVVPNELHAHESQRHAISTASYNNRLLTPTGVGRDYWYSLPTGAHASTQDRHATRREQQCEGDRL